jgi:two-component system nitrate/nitrite response regulator NarL
MAQRIRLLIVDDHTMFRQGLASLLGVEAAFRVVGQAADGEQALRLFEELQPDVVLMDVMMPCVDGVEATRRLLETTPHARILMLTVSDADEDLLAAIRAGARGYILKDADADELFEAIRRVHAGEAVLSPAVTLRVLQAVRRTPPPPAPARPLTPREREVAWLLARGASNREIAETLMISENTVKTHVAHILEKLGIQSRRQVAAYVRHLDRMP